MQAHRGGVGSLCAGDSSRPTCFVSGGSEDGLVKLWDTRLPRKKDFITIADKSALSDLMEMQWCPAEMTATAVCGDRLVWLDFRQPTGPQHVESLPSDVSFVSRSSRRSRVGRDGSDALLVADDDGNLYVTDVAAGKGCHKVPILPVEGHTLDNICCGMGQSFDAASGVTVDWVLSMGGLLSGLQLTPTATAGWRAAVIASHNVMEGDDRLGQARTGAAAAKRQQLCNPPIPTCMAVSGGEACGDVEGRWIAVGHADGQYTIMESTPFGEGEVALVAPGHESNGLVSLSWIPKRGSDGGICDSLLTVALSGEVTLWHVGPLLAPVEEGDDGTSGELPDVLFAASTREATMRPRAVMNCATVMTQTTDHRYSCLLGDDDGTILLCDIGDV